MVLDYFDAAFVINVDGHTERWQRVSAELSRIGIECERFSAIVPDSRSAMLDATEIGCSLSHCAVVKIAKRRGYNTILILEDDVVFRPDFSSSWLSIVNDLAKIPFDLFYFYDWERVEQCSMKSKLVRTDGTLCTHAYAISKCFYDRFLTEVLAQIDTSIIDQTLLKIKAEKWAVTPNLAGQAEGYSTIYKCIKRFRWSAKDS